jgi:sugar phosphate isomerase/epimerase
VGWTYRHWPLRRLFQAAHDYGYDCVELRSCADVDFSTAEGVQAGLRAAAKASRDTGVSASVVYLHNFVVAEPAELTARNPLLLSPQALAPVRDSGATMVQILLERVRPDGSHVLSSHEASEQDFAACREALEILGEAIEPFGLRVAVEVRSGTIADTLEGLLWTTATLDHEVVGVNLDFANLHLANPELDLADAIAALGPRITYTHFKSVKHQTGGLDETIPLDLGCIDYFAVLAALRRCGYAGLLGVEYCGGGDPDVFVRRDAEYLRWLGRRLEQTTWIDPDADRASES